MNASVDGSRGYSGTVHGNKSWEVGKDEAFVIGDNYSNSIDSRTYGPIKVDAIIGKVVAVHRRNP